MAMAGHGLMAEDDADHRRWLTSRLVRWTFRQLGFAYFRLRVDGLDRIPSRGGVMLAGNHPNVLDGLLLLVVSPRRVRFLIAEDLYTHRYLHRFFKAMGMIPVSRTQTHNGEALRSAVEALERGEVLGIFPEGTTHFRGSMEQVKQGIALLALKTGVPVVPFGIQGSFEAFPEGARFPRPRTISLRFEAPVRYPQIHLAQIPEADVAQTLEHIRLRILEAMQAIGLQAPWRPTVPQWLKELQIALSGLIVLPLAGFLSCTANPSLDPHDRRAVGSR